MHRFIYTLVSLLIALAATARGPVKADGATPAPAGLDGRTLAVWQSHGLYFNNEKGEWMWQRAPLLQTIEDVYSASYVLDLLVPMLENAGAYVMLPRERDLHSAEVIVDADSPASPGFSTSDGAARWTLFASGFALPEKPLADNDNPFSTGTAMQVMAIAPGQKPSKAAWHADIPADGTYNIYISYASLPESASAVKYTVNSLRGPETFTVDQTMGGGTWIRLGEFPLAKGSSELPVVELTNVTDARNAGKTITADAVRIGGGMGSVARGTARDGSDYAVSGLPRWLEGARYWLQYAGAPAWVYASSDTKTDYNDDYRSRPTWVNWLAGGSPRLPKEKGLGIPVDLALALHTDAGTTPDSTIVGTLGIYSTDGGAPLGDGRRRTACRDLTTAIVDQVVNDIQALHEPLWTKRKLRDRKYAEARIPKVPTALIELLSHQNFADMRHGQNPQFRFDASRAIYKGILKYLAGPKGKYVVQPLPVNSFAITSRGDGHYRLSWLPTTDPLEPTAIPTTYDVEMRLGDGIFLPLSRVDTPQLDFVAEHQGVVYSFRVIARNDGGASFPSEVLSLCHSTGYEPEVLIINAFTRISAPEWIETPDQAGFIDEIDHGVPYIRNIGYIGSQYEYDRSRPWVDDIIDPGFGASNKDWLGHPVAGNTFDYPYIHGCAIAAAGYPFISASLDGYIANAPSYNPSIIDLILGKQREVPVGTYDAGTRFKAFTPELQQLLEQHTLRHGSLLVSGSYVASDIFANPHSSDSVALTDAAFARRVLGIELETPFAAVNGTVKVLPFWTNGRHHDTLKYNSTLSETIYIAESPDAIISAGRGDTQTLMLYAENNRSAAVASLSDASAVVTLGFPFETIITPADRNRLMTQLLRYLLPIPIPSDPNARPSIAPEPPLMPAPLTPIPSNPALLSVPSLYPSAPRLLD